MKTFEQLYELYGRIERRGREHRAGARRRHPELEAAGRQHLPSHPAPAHPARLQPQRPRVHPHRDRQGGGAVLGAVPLHAGHRGQGAGALPRGPGSRRLPSLGGTDTLEFLRRFVVQLSPRGQFAEGPPEKEAEDPKIGRAPVLFLRTRTLASPPPSRARSRISPFARTSRWLC